MLVRIVDDMDHHHALYGHVVKRIFGPKVAICFDAYAFLAIVLHYYIKGLQLHNMYYIF